MKTFFGTMVIICILLTGGATLELIAFFDSGDGNILTVLGGIFFAMLAGVWALCLIAALVRELTQTLTQLHRVQQNSNHQLRAIQKRTKE